MQPIAALCTILVIVFLASSVASGIVTYVWVEEVNRKRARTVKPRKWNRDLIGIVSAYRAVCPEGELIWPLVAALFSRFPPEQHYLPRPSLATV